MTKNSYCCKHMSTAVENQEIPINYNPILREYSLNLNSPAIQLINYCPWCSKKLPTSLRDAFFELLENEYQIDDGILEILDNKNLPKEFKSDAWWKNRNL